MKRNDQFSAVFQWDSKYKYTMEILRNGKPFFDEFDGHKKDFRFGTKKASAILRAMPVIRTFADSRAKAPAGAKFPITHCMEDQVVAWYDRFRAHGRVIDKPYLQIRKEGENLMAFGIEKCESLVELEHEIRGFVADPKTAVDRARH